MTTNRYARNIAIKDIGPAGQEALKHARVGVLGAGGLGSPILYYLAAAGVGFLTVADSDVVDESNLQRQILHSTPRIGQSKALSAKQTLEALNPDVTVEAVTEHVTEQNVANIFGNLDIVVEASDNFEAKFLLGDFCAETGQPLVWGTLVGLNAMVTTFVSRTPPAYPDTKPVTLRDLYPHMPDPASVDTAKEKGVLGAAAGIAGSLMAMETIRLITSMPNPLIRRLALIDAREPGMRVTNF